MKISMNKLGYYVVHTGNSCYKDVLDVVEAVDEIDIEILADETNFDEVKSKLKFLLKNKEYKYDFNKLLNILIDGVFTRKRSKETTLSRKAQSYNSRVSRMMYNLETASRLGIEVQIKNKILKESNHDTNETNLLGL